MARSVMRRPVVSLVVTAGVLIAAAIAYFDINIGAGGIRNLPDTLETKQAFLLLEKEFSFGVVSPAEIVVDGDVNSDAVQAGIGRLEAALDQDPDFVGRSQKQDNGRDLTLLSIPVDGDPTGDVAIDAINRLRGQYIPQAFSGVQADVLVTGETAFNVDFFEITDRFTPVVFVVVLGLSFVLLTLVFRSIVVPVKAIIMNLLSVGAAYGLVVLVIQKGYGADLLGFQRADMIEAWIPLFMFSVLFGLSTWITQMD